MADDAGHSSGATITQFVLILLVVLVAVMLGALLARGSGDACCPSQPPQVVFVGSCGDGDGGGGAETATPPPGPDPGRGRPLSIGGRVWHENDAAPGYAPPLDTPLDAEPVALTVLTGTGWQAKPPTTTDPDGKYEFAGIDPITGAPVLPPDIFAYQVKVPSQPLAPPLVVWIDPALTAVAHDDIDFPVLLGP